MDDEEAQFLLEDEDEKVGKPVGLFVYFTRLMCLFLSARPLAPVALPWLVCMQSDKAAPGIQSFAADITSRRSSSHWYCWWRVVFA